MSRELLELARRAGQEAAQLVRAQRPDGRVAVMTTKTTPTDVVTAVDQASEQLIRERILSARPDDGFLGEEGDSLEGTSGIRWIVDPIDGTVNFIYGVPAYAVSIAAQISSGERSGETVAGYVVNIATGEEYGAVAGQGAWYWQGEQQIALHGPPPMPLAELLVATGFNYSAEVRTRQAAAVARLLPQVRDVRRIGSAALDLVGLASGRLDAYVEQGLKPWDLAAGGLIAAEAGLIVGGLNGLADERLVLASRSDIWEEYSALIHACGF